MKRIFLAFKLSILISAFFLSASQAQTVDYNNLASVTAHLKGSCFKSLAKASTTDGEKRLFCTCVTLAIMGSAPNNIELKALIDNDFNDEMRRLSKRPLGWNKAIYRCFK